MSLSSEATDRAMMARCIELSLKAVGEGEYPFGSVVVLDGRIIAEATNRTARDNDVSRHAEVIALSQAQQAASRLELRRATLYSNVEPCAMCSYCIREAWIGRVVYAIGSPVMGGLSKWNILRDDGISDIPQIFGAMPEVVSGVQLHQAQQIWRDWNPADTKAGRFSRHRGSRGCHVWQLSRKLAILVTATVGSRTACADDLGEASEIFSVDG